MGTITDLKGCPESEIPARQIKLNTSLWVFTPVKFHIIRFKASFLCKAQLKRWRPVFLALNFATLSSSYGSQLPSLHTLLFVWHTTSLNNHVPLLIKSLLIFSFLYKDIKLHALRKRTTDSQGEISGCIHNADGHQSN